MFHCESLASRGAKSPVRVHAARQVKALTDSLMHEDKKLKLFVMGDMNDDPMDESMQTLGPVIYIRYESQSVLQSLVGNTGG